MHEHAYLAQCDVEEARHRPRETERSVMLMLVALALGTFAIGSGEFGSNGIVQLFADDLGVSVPTATNAITAYALGVVIGSPVLTIVAARLNRRTLLLGLVGLFVVGNLLSALASDFGLLVVARFITGTVQGAYFGAGAVVAVLRLRSRKGRQGLRHRHGRPDHRHHRRLAHGDLHRSAGGMAGPLRGAWRRRACLPERRSGSSSHAPPRSTGDPSRRSSAPCVARWCG